MARDFHFHSYDPVEVHNDFIPSFVEVIETVIDTDTNLPVQVSVVRELTSDIDSRTNLNADDFRLEHILNSGNLEDLKEMPKVSLSALSFSDSITRGFEILNNIKQNIKE